MAATILNICPVPTTWSAKENNNFLADICDLNKPADPHAYNVNCWAPILATRREYHAV
jgi:hypothetical protein